MPKRKQATPMTQAERDQVAELHAQGMSRAAIARQLGRAPDTIGKAAAQLGLDWDRSKTAVATKAKQEDNRAKRVRLISRLYDRADSVLSRLEADTFYATTDWEGRVLVTPVKQDEIPPMAEKQLGGMAANYLLAASRLEAIDSDDGSAVAKGLLGRLQEGLHSLNGQLGDGGKAA